MPDTIYYVYEKATGAFAGSGVSLIENETHSSTTVAPLDAPDEPILEYDKQLGTWAWRMPVVQQKIAEPG